MPSRKIIAVAVIRLGSMQSRQRIWQRLADLKEIQKDLGKVSRHREYARVKDTDIDKAYFFTEINC